MLRTSQQDRVLYIALNRPEKRNALNGALCEALVNAVDHANVDPAVRSIVLSGNGPAFCAGMDLSETQDFAPLHEQLFTIINRITKPVIAGVQGAALAGGTGLAANAHIVVASPDARFGLTEIRVGLWPVLVFRSVRLAIGERRATELSITGRILTATEAERYGLVTEIHEDPLRRASEIAATVASYSARAMQKGLAYVREIQDMSWADAGRAGAAIRPALMNHEDFTTAVKGFRKPES